jgi:high frequency lysogenization protein
LAGVIQSAALVQQLARTGELPSQAHSALMKSIFVLDPPDVVTVYGRLANLSLGLDMLEKILFQRSGQQYSEIIGYTIGILHLERQLHKHPDLNEILRVNLQKVAAELDYFDGDVTHPGVISKLAQLYLNTMGTFRYRIRVKGDSRILEREENASRVRALLLAGIRSALLWRQTGGSRIQFIFARNRMLKTVRQIREKIVLE